MTGKEWAGFRPTVRQRRIAIELRRLRESAGMTVEDVAAMLNCNPLEMVAIERCHRPIAREPFVVLLRLAFDLKDDDEHISYLYGLATDDEAKGWTHVPRASMPEYERMGLRLIGGASGMWMYAPTAIPKVFQSREYMRTSLSLMGVDRVDTTDELGHWVGAQSMLFESRLPIRAVIGEGAFRCRMVSTELLYHQCVEFIRLAKLDNVDIRVLPISSAASVACPCGFVVLDFASPASGCGVVCLENLTRTDFVDDDTEVMQYRHAYDALYRAALDADESLNFIRDVRDGKRPRKSRIGRFRNGDVTTATVARDGDRNGH